MHTYIYILKDPRTGETRYVGKTIRPKTRLRQHVHDAKTTSYKKSQWVKGLLKDSLLPILSIVDEVADVNDVATEEQFYIEYLSALGCRLLNMTEGGDGVLGYKPSPEKRAKRSEKLKEWHKNNPHPMLGRTHSERTRNQLSQKLTGRVSNRKGVVLTDIQKNRMSRAHDKFKKPVSLQNIDSGEIRRFPSARAAAKELELDWGNFGKVRKGVCKQIDGWKIVE